MNSPAGILHPEDEAGARWRMPAAPGYIAALDGLRAVAVLSVMIYHLRPQALRGGHFGVDIFFVISGFVVTASLADMRFSRFFELAGRFWARRVRRILPALLVMLVLTTIAATLLMPWMWMTASGSTWTAIYAPFGASNIVLAQLSDAYFTPTAQYSAFFHTWSLGVEEQFYLLFPILYWFCRGRRTRLGAVALIGLPTLASFLLYLWMRLHDPVAAFYLMPTRFWELGTGMLLWLTIDVWRPRLSTAGKGLLEAAALATVALLAALCLRGGLHGEAPGRLAVVVASAMLIALVTAAPRLRAARLLSLPPMLGVGRMSYSLYLWHVPVFVAFKWTVGLESLLAATAAVVLAFVAALLSYRLVEQPVRESRGLAAARPRWVLAGALAAMVATTAGTALALFLVLPPLLKGSEVWGGAVAPSRCAATVGTRSFAGGEIATWTPACPSPQGSVRLFVVGDSHARAYGPMLERYAGEAGVTVISYARSGCAAPALSDRPGPACAEWNKAAFEKLSGELHHGDILFFVASHVPRFGGIWGADDRPPPPTTAKERDAAFQRAVQDLRRLSRTGARLLIQEPPPVYRSAFYRCTSWVSRSNPACKAGFDEPRREQQALRRPVVETMRRLVAEVPNASLFDPFPILCPKDPCSVIADGKNLYLDDNHISGHGANLLYPHIQKKLLEIEGRS